MIAVAEVHVLVMHISESHAPRVVFCLGTRVMTSLENFPSVDSGYACPAISPG
jgi:hypothetical protein